MQVCRYHQQRAPIDRRNVGAGGTGLFVCQLVHVVDGTDTLAFCCCCCGGYCQTGALVYGTLVVDFGCWPLITVVLLAKDAPVPAGLLGDGVDAICSEAKSPS
jgi:hypothetical protein